MPQLIRVIIETKSILFYEIIFEVIDRTDNFMLCKAYILQLIEFGNPLRKFLYKSL
jgi:polyhydroxyalkanoate synthesis regulator protein